MHLYIFKQLLVTRYSQNLTEIFLTCSLRFRDLWIPEATGSHDSEKGDQTERWGNKKISGDFLLFFPPRWSALSSHRCLLFTESAFLLSWLATFFFLLNTSAVFMTGEFLMASGLVFSSSQHGFSVESIVRQHVDQGGEICVEVAAKHQWKDRGVFAWRIELKGWYQRLGHVNPVAPLTMTLSSLSGARNTMVRAS